MKKVFFLTAVVASLAGAALHFLHDALPNVLTALISPVNESVWEHLKLLYWPMLLSGFFLSRQAGKEARRRLEQLGEYGETASALTVVRERHRLWGGIFAAELIMPVFLLGVYYLLQHWFGGTGLVVDVVLYFAALALGYGIACGLYRSGRAEAAAPWLLLPVVFYGAALVLFTFAAPGLSIFQPPMGG